MQTILQVVDVSASPDEVFHGDHQYGRTTPMVDDQGGRDDDVIEFSFVPQAFNPQMRVDERRSVARTTGNASGTPDGMQLTGRRLRVEVFDVPPAAAPAFEDGPRVHRRRM